jgi:N-acetyl-anhydromuramyl-L-alanine amidase AmpD
MKRFLAYTLCFAFISSFSAKDIFPENKYAALFKKAYLINPSIPKGALEAIAFTQTRFEHLKDQAESCIGYPQAKGVFGLVENGKGYFRNNLQFVAAYSGYRSQAIAADPEINVMAFAGAFTALQSTYNVYGKDLKEYTRIFIALSELPVAENIKDDYILNTHLYQLFWFLNNKEAAAQYQFPEYAIDMHAIFGENLKVLSSAHIYVEGNSISNGQQSYKLNSSASIYSADYPPALWDAAASCNYSSRNSTPISAVTIHFVQGTYAGCISWFKNCSASASAHYVVRSSDGQVTQMVLEANKAWHVGSENPYTVGIEHEGYISSASWFTNAMYNGSAALSKDICTSNSINPLRTYYGPSCSGSSAQCQLGNCTKVKGHQHYANQTHTDPGPNWNWAKYYKLINNTYTVVTYTASAGNFYDTGGPSANYSDDERKFWLITKPNITNITLNFTSFNLEPGYDNMFIYDGGSVNSSLIGQYSGTVNPGPVTSNNDSLLIEFRSDCATTASGWAATYTTNSSAPTTSDVISPNTTINALAPWITTTFTSNYTDIDNAGGSGIEKGYYQAIDFNGTEWRANYTHGFFADNFDNAIHPEWTIKTGTWSVSGNALLQSDETSTVATNTNIYAALTQSLSNRYLYHFLAKFEGTQANRRAGLHFFVDQPDSSNRNNSYFVWFRLDDQKVQIYKVVNNVFGSPQYDGALTFNAAQWYDIKIIYDRVTGKMNVYMNNAKIATWTDPAPYTNGGFISFRSGNCKFSVDEIKVYRSRAAATSISVGSGLANDLRYQNPSPIQAAGKIKSICQDSAGNLSPIFYQDINIDWTPPSNIATVNDGNAADISIVNTTDSLRANWSPSGDANSGIVRYWYSIGTAPGSTNTLGWTSNWAATSVTAKTLTLVQNTVYYFNVRSENGAGMLSGITSSNGQKVDTTVIATLLNSASEIDYLDVFPNPFKDLLTINTFVPVDSKIIVTACDILGREFKLYEGKESKGKLSLSLNFANASMAPGTYILKVNINDKIYQKKIIKNN